MTITRVDSDDLNITLSIKIEKNDYEDAVAKNLKEYRRKAHVQGFRPGNVPMSLVQKKYGAGIVYDETLKLLDNAINEYIKENHLRVLGEPIPNESTPSVDFSMHGDFEFIYDFALRPAVKVDTSKIQLTYYNLQITEDDKQKRLDNELREFGTIIDLEVVEGSDFLVFVDVAQNADNGVNVKNAILSAQSIPQAQQTLMHGKKIGETLEANIREMLVNDADCAAFLNIKKNRLSDIEPLVSMTIRRIIRNIPAQMNQEFFDKMYGQGIISNTEEFMARLNADMQAAAAHSSDMLFARHAHETLMQEADVPLPERTLSRWLKLSANKKDSPLTNEEFEKETNEFFQRLRWRLIIEQIADENSIDITDDDLRQQLAMMVRREMMAYGIYSIADADLEQYVNSRMDDRNARMHAAENALVSKVIAALKTLTKINYKTISREEFNKLLNSH